MGLLERIATQNYVYNGMFINSTTTLPSSSTFEPPLWAIRINVLWFASLVLSIAVASLGILVKQWLREFLAMEYSSPRERLRARNYRMPTLDKWYLFEIAAALPMILQISLVLFFAGLCLFTSAVHNSVRDITVPIVCAWAFFIFITTVAPLFSPRCPFKTTFLKTAMKAGRLCIAPRARRITMFVSEYTVTLYENIMRQVRPQTDKPAEPKKRPTLADILTEEDDVVRLEQDDSSTLLDVDAVVADDNLIPTMLEVLPNSKPHIVVEFVRRLIWQREGIQAQFLGDLEFPYRISTLPSQAWALLANTLADHLMRNSEVLSNSNDFEWAVTSIVLLLFEHPSDAGIQALRMVVESARGRKVCGSLFTHLKPAMLLRFDEMVSQDDSLLPKMAESIQHLQPQPVVDFVLEIVRHRTAVKDLVFSPDLSALSSQAWATFVRILTDLLGRECDTLSKKSGRAPSWAIDSTILLLSQHGDNDDGVQSLRTFVTSDNGEKACATIIPYLGHAALFRFAEMVLTKDSPLPTLLASLNRRQPLIIVGVVLRIVRNCTGSEALSVTNLDFVLNLDMLPQPSWIAIVDTLSELLRNNREQLTNTDGQVPSWGINSTILLLSEHGTNDNGAQALRTLISSENDGARICAEIVPHLKRAALFRFADTILVEDSSLPKVFGSLQRHCDPQVVVTLVLGVAHNRTGIEAPYLTNPESTANLHTLSSPIWTTIVGTLSDLLQRNLEQLAKNNGQIPPWAIDSTILLLSYRNDDEGVQALRTLIASENGVRVCAAIIPHLKHAVLFRFAEMVLTDDLPLPTILGSLHHRDPQDTVRFVMRIVCDRTGTPTTNIKFLPNLHTLSQQAWNAFVTTLSTLLESHREALTRGGHIPAWAVDSTILLLSEHGDDSHGLQALHTFASKSGAETSVELLLSADLVLVDDSVLPKMFHVLQHCAPHIVVDFTLKCIRNRSEVALTNSEGHLSSIIDLRMLSETACRTFIYAAGNLLAINVLAPHEDAPLWVLDAVILLLSMSSYPLPESHAQTVLRLLVPQDMTADHQHASNGPHISIADHVFRSWTSAPVLAFKSIAQLYISLSDEAGDTQHLYGTLLSYYSHPDESDAVDETPFPHPILFDLLLRLLLWRCGRNDELVAEEYEALQAVLDMGARDTCPLDTDEVLDTFYRHPTHVYCWMSCYSGIQTTVPDSIHAFCVLFKSPYSPGNVTVSQININSHSPHPAGEDRHSVEAVHTALLRHAISTVDEYCEDSPTTYRSALESLDLVRLCNLYLRTWVSRVVGQAPTLDDISLFPLWSELWMALAKGIAEYHERKAWEALQEAPAWRVGSRVLSPGEVLACDAKLAQDCLLVIQQWQIHMDFPVRLENALHLFSAVVPGEHLQEGRGIGDEVE